MNAVEIIDKIKGLPPGEQAQVVRFVRALEEERTWTPQELSEAAASMVAENNPVKAKALWEQIAAGFYGNRPNA